MTLSRHYKTHKAGQKKYIQIQEYTSSSDNPYKNIYKRINLQSIGYFIKEGSNLKNKNCSSFSQRKCLAEKEPEEELA